MGLVVFICLVLVEATVLLVGARLRVPSRKWVRIRTTVSVCEAVALTLLMALPVPGIALDFRWTALLAVLVVRAAIALAVFIARKGKASDEIPHRMPQMALNVVGSIVVIALATVPALLFPAYDGLPVTGSYGVCEAHAIMVDASRVDSFEQDGSFREVPVWFYYPDVADAEAGSFPLVVFSHGAFGYHESNYSLYAELASHGYVVAALDYPHHAFFATDTQGETVIVDRTFMSQAMAMQNGTLSDGDSYALEQEWMQLRMADLGFALDTIEAAVQSGLPEGGEWFFDSDEQKVRVQEALQMTDVEKVGLIGHSMGGATSVGQGRIRGEVGAVVDLDGTMLTERQSDDGKTYMYEEDPYPVPLLSIDNEGHFLSGAEADDVGEPYVNNVVLDNAKTSAHTYFRGSGHMNFTDLPLFSPMLASMLGTGVVDARTCIEQTNALVLAWFDEYLKGEGHATVAESY